VLFLSNADASAVAPSTPGPMPLSDACVATHTTKHNFTVLSRTITSHHHPHTAHAAHNTHSSITATLTADIQMLQRVIPL
jgi:hypothetical protein